MYFINDIHEIATSMNLEFYHGPKSFQNLQDQVKKDEPLKHVCYMHFPIRGKVTRVKQGFGAGTYNLELLFGAQSQLHWEMSQHITVIQAMELLSHNFMNKLLNHNNIKEVTDYVPTEVINFFDMNLSGVIIECTVTPFDRRANCG